MTRDYAIANFHTLQITTTHAKSFQSVAISTSRSLVTASNSGDSSTAPARFPLDKFPYDSLLAHSVVTPTNFQTVSVLKSRHGLRRKHRSVLRSDRFSWECVCLKRRYPVTAAYACLLRFCCLATNVVSLFVSRSLPNNESTRNSILFQFLIFFALKLYYFRKMTGQQYAAKGLRIWGLC
jgi:hypothetical protein